MKIKSIGKMQLLFNAFDRINFKEINFHLFAHFIWIYLNSNIVISSYSFNDWLCVQQTTSVGKCKFFSFSLNCKRKNRIFFKFPFTSLGQIWTYVIVHQYSNQYMLNIFSNGALEFAWKNKYQLKRLQSWSYTVRSQYKDTSSN